MLPGLPSTGPPVLPLAVLRFTHSRATLELPKSRLCVPLGVENRDILASLLYDVAGERRAMLRLGCIVLTIWGGIHLIASALSLLVSLTGHYAPMMKIVFSDREIGAYDRRTLGVTKSLAILHNTGALIFGGLVLVLTWSGIQQGSRWAFWALLSAGLLAQGMWFVADSVVGNPTRKVNLPLTALFVVGAALSGYALYGA